MIKEIEAGRLSYKMPKPDVPVTLTDYLSDEEVGKQNKDLWKQDSEKIE